MRITNSNKMGSVASAGLRTMLLGLVVLFTTGCGPDSTDGTPFTSYTLPTDLILGLRCEDAGVYRETCVLLDEENPYQNIPTGEFDENNPDEPIGKLELLEEIPPGPTGAKARFYLWATALARRSSGENQYYTARALHELWTAQVQIGIGDPLVRRQAVKAYRSVLDNYFGSVTFFGPFGFPEVFVSQQLNLLVGDHLHRQLATSDASSTPSFYPNGYSLLLPVTEENLMRNDSFEETSPGTDALDGDVACSRDWTCFNNAFTTSNLYQPGGNSVNPTALTDTQVLKQFGGDGGAFQEYPVTPHETYTASVYAMNWAGDEFNNLALLQLTFLDDLGVQVGEALEVFADTVGGENILLAPRSGLSPSDWTELSVQGTAPPDAVTARLLLLHIDIGGGGGSIFWDDASLEGLPVPSPLGALGEIGEWGYTYVPCGVDCPNDGVLSVNVF